LKRHIVLALCISTALSILAFGHILAQAARPELPASPAGSAGKNPWFNDYIEFNDSDTGAYASLAYNTRTDRPSIAYYDATLNALRLATQVASGGNCGPHNTWSCQTVAITDATYISLDIYPGSPQIINSSRTGIAYYNPSTRSLNFAEYSCALLCKWSFSMIEKGSTGLSSSTRGQYASFKYDSSGGSHIAYYLWSQMFSEELRYAKYQGSGGNCGPKNYWQCQTIDRGVSLGQYASLDISYNGQVYLAYYDGGAGNLKYAYYGGIGDCYNNNGWICFSLDGTDGSDVGYYASLSAPQSASDVLRIAYYDKTHAKLKYIFPHAGDNCHGVNGWWCGNVDNMGSTIQPMMGISLKMDKDGAPIIAYEYVPADPGHSVLRIARPYYVYGSQFGNCGDTPPGYLFNYWTCSTLDIAGAETEEAEFVSLAINNSGLAMIAYHENDNYYNPNLKIAYQRWLIYAPYTEK
jgi:hypothetical protein